MKNPPHEEDDEVGERVEIKKKHTPNVNYAQTLKPMHQQRTIFYLQIVVDSREASANMNLICNRRHAY